MNISALIKGTFLFALLFLICFFAYDQIFSKPKIHRGIVLEKLFIPQHTVAGPNSVSYSNHRAYKYIVQTQKYHQWIAIVKADDGDTLKVHCKSKHFEQTMVGDTLLFKEYKGDVFGIDYLAHSEEDTVKTDLRVLK